MKLTDDAIRFYANSYGKKYRLDPALIYAVIHEESSGDTEAVNPSDPSAGLLQVMADNGRKYGGLIGTDEMVLKALHDPVTNLICGCGFLAHLQGLFGKQHSVTEWVQAYNVGAHGFSEGHRNPAYGAAIQKYMDQFEVAHSA